MCTRTALLCLTALRAGIRHYWGLHQPYPILVAKGRIFGRPLYDYPDSGQTVAKSYAVFLFEIPAGYRGVARVTYADGLLLLRERGDRTDRDLSMEVEKLFSQR